jgi:hypothetical protein
MIMIMIMLHMRLGLVVRVETGHDQPNHLFSNMVCRLFVCIIYIYVYAYVYTVYIYTYTRTSCRIRMISRPVYVPELILFLNIRIHTPPAAVHVQLLQNILHCMRMHMRKCKFYFECLYVHVHIYICTYTSNFKLESMQN